MKTRPLVTAATVIVAISMADMASAANAKKGKKQFRKCVACHTVKRDGKHKIGPNLFNIVGRPAGKAEGYNYSKAMRASNLTWDAATLDAFIKKPRSVIKKTKMSFAGIKQDNRRAQLIAYLKTFTE